MSEYGVTEKGFVPKRLDVILKEMHRDLSDGFDVDTAINPQSLLGVLVTGVADKIAELWEVAQDVYFSQYPSSASGLSLDNAVAYGGVKRAADQKTYYSILCTGDDGTVVPEGTIIESTTKPPISFLAAQSKAISRSEFNRVSVKVLSVQEQAVYTVGINGNLFTYSTGSGATEEGILAGLRDAIVDPDFTAEVQKPDNGAPVLYITDESAQRGNLLLLSENLTTESVSTLVTFDSKDFGKYLLPDGSITSIVTNTPGLKSCVNLVAPIFGRYRENDAELRQSYIKRIAIRSNCMLESISSAILDKVQGVVSVATYKNDSNAWDSEGRPPHSIEVVVDGGGEMEIAKQILEKKAGGIQTMGNVTVDVPDLYGRTIPISFNRPQYVYLWLRVVLTVNPYEAMPPNYAELTKQSIIDQIEDIKVGVGIFTQRLLNGIYQKVSGVAYVEIKAFDTTDPGAAPGLYEKENVVVTARQKAVIEEKRIEVSLKDVSG